MPGIEIGLAPGARIRDAPRGGRVYTVIGSDGQEYGPVHGEQLHGWLRERRVDANTKVRWDDGPWVALGSLPEFAGLAGAPQREPQGAHEAAANAVRGPATALLWCGILGAISSVLNFASAGAGAGANMRLRDADIPPEAKPCFDWLAQFDDPRVYTGSGILHLAISFLFLVASRRLLALQSRGLVLTASALAIFPCTSPCCCVTMAVGVWTMAVLMRPEVKAAFA